MILENNQFDIHVIRVGETLYQIADKHGLPLAELIRANLNIMDPNCLEPGELILIPLELSNRRLQKAKAVLETCKELLHVSYSYPHGFTNKDCFCSDFFQTAFQKNGIQIPSTSSLQSNQGMEVTLEEIEPTDLLFFTTRTRSKKYPSYNCEYIGHTAIYLGNNKILHPGWYEKKKDLIMKMSDYNKGVLVTARRLIVERVAWEVEPNHTQLSLPEPSMT